MKLFVGLLVPAPLPGTHQMTVESRLQSVWRSVRKIELHAVIQIPEPLVRHKWGVRHEERSPQAERPVAILTQKPHSLLGVEGVAEQALRHGRWTARRAPAGPLVLPKRVDLGTGESRLVRCRVHSMGKAVPTTLVDEMHLADRSRRIALVAKEMCDCARPLGQWVTEDPGAMPAGIVSRDD